MMQKNNSHPRHAGFGKRCKRAITAAAIATIMSVGVFAQSNAQTPYRNTPVSISVKNESLQKTLDKIATLANVRFFYNHREIDTSKRINLSAKNQPLDNVLNTLLAGMEVTIEYQPDRTVVFLPKTRNTLPDDLKKQISGKVIDASTKEPLIGVAVVWQTNKSKGVATDNNGDFSLVVPEGIPALELSYIGYQSQTLKITDAPMTHLVIAMRQDALVLDEAIITGIQRKSKESFTGDFVRIKGDELIKLSPNKVLNALQFFDPSFRVLESMDRGSDPNALPEFRMRGDVQLGDAVKVDNLTMMLDGYANIPNMPLFVLDGFQVPVQRIIDLDPERIKEVVILKDAAATSVYGSKATNGVIVFETKAPKQGALNVSYSSNIGVTLPDLSGYNLMNAAEKLEAEQKAGFFNPKDAEAMNLYNAYKAEVLRGVNTYWLSQPLRTAITHRHSFSVEGGEEALRYRLGVNYQNTPGVMKKSDRTGAGFNLNLIYRRGKWNMSNSISINNTKANNTPYGSFREYTLLNPYYRIYDGEGKYKKLLDTKYQGAGKSTAQIRNPLYNTQFVAKDYTQGFTVTNNTAIEYRLMENLRLSGNLSYSRNTASTENFVSPNNTRFDLYQANQLTEKGEYRKRSGNSTTWSADLSVDYNLQLNKHLISAFGRWDITSTNGEFLNLTAKGFPSDKMTDFLFGYKMTDRPGGSDSQTRSLGLIGSVSYMYDMLYSLDMNIRTDLSSSFGADNRLAPFWSVGGRWNISREQWFKEATWLSDLVLRASYGITGSQNYAPYQAIQSYSFTEFMSPYLSSDVIGAGLLGIGNKHLGWSTTGNLNIGMEMALLKNRIQFSYSYYNNYTDQLLVDFSLPPSVGFSSMTENAGAIRNTGHQFNLSVTPYRDTENRMQWVMSLGATTNDNRIEKISNTLAKRNKVNLESKGAPLPIYVEGEPTTRIFLVRSLGIDPATGRELYLDREGNRTFVWNAADKVPVGNTAPKVAGNVNSSFNYKDFNMSFAFMFDLGSDRYNSTLVDKIENANLAYNADRRALTERWSPEKPEALYKAINILGQDTPQSTRFLQRFNEFRFNSISLSYRFDPKFYAFLDKMNLASMSVSGNIQDIARISTVKQERGLDYPFARSFSLSLSLIFK